MNCSLVGRRPQSSDPSSHPRGFVPAMPHLATYEVGWKDPTGSQPLPSSPGLQCPWGVKSCWLTHSLPTVLREDKVRWALRCGGGGPRREGLRAEPVGPAHTTGLGSEGTSGSGLHSQVGLVGFIMDGETEAETDKSAMSHESCLAQTGGLWADPSQGPVCVGGGRSAGGGLGGAGGAFQWGAPRNYPVPLWGLLCCS